MTDIDIKSDGLGADGDAFYSCLMELHESLGEAESHAFNARLVLLMANEIGDLKKLESIMKAARSVRS